MKCLVCSAEVCEHQWKRTSTTLTRAERAEAKLAHASNALLRIAYDEVGGREPHIAATTLSELRDWSGDVVHRVDEGERALAARQHVRELRGDLVLCAERVRTGGVVTYEDVRAILEGSITALPDLGDLP